MKEQTLLKMVVLGSFSLPTEGIRLEQRDTTAYLNNASLGKGTLYIAEGNLTWISSSNNGFSIGYGHISLHAVSRDLNAFPEECIYLMLDTSIDGNEEDADNSDPEVQGTTELRFVPEDRGMLDAMFHALSACQALHPDSEDSFSEDEFYDDDDDDGGIPVDETSLRMASLCIGQNMASFSASEEDMTYMAGNMTENRMMCSENRWPDYGQLLGMPRTFCSLCNQEEEPGNSIEDELEGCFDDAES